MIFKIPRKDTKTQRRAFSKAFASSCLCVEKLKKFIHNHLKVGKYEYISLGMCLLQGDSCIRRNDTTFSMSFLRMQESPPKKQKVKEIY